MRVIRESVHGERGAVATLLVLLGVVFLGMLALAVDGGLMLVKFRGVRTANDAAALASALSCAMGEGQPAADAQANSYAAANVSDAVTVAAPVYDPACDAPAGKVTVRYGGSQNLMFSPVVGVSSPKPVNAAATAVWGAAGASNRVSPLMLDMNRMSDCEIPFGPDLYEGKVCTFWWDNDQDFLGNAAWGLMNLSQWGVSPTTGCSNAGQSQYQEWIEFGFPGILQLNDPPPTYVCRDSGFFGGALDRGIQKAIDSGDPYAFPVNDSANQIDRDGALCPPPDCTPDKYYIVGFAWLRLTGLYRRQDPEFATFCGGFPASANARCLVAEWVGFSTSGLRPGGGQNFGLISIGLTE
jgi:Flp pilus assembly protein TadG